MTRAGTGRREAIEAGSGRPGAVDAGIGRAAIVGAGRASGVEAGTGRASGVEAGTGRAAGVAGVGIGWRPEIAGFVAGLPGLRFCEVIAESLPLGGPLPDGLDTLLERGVAVIPHGVRLSLGGAEPVDPHRVEHFAATAALVGAPLVSEHVAFVRAGGVEAGHLLPVPRSRESLAALVANVRRTQSELDVPLALEPIATLFDWPDDELTEAQFLTELLDATGAQLLLDIANVYANARNRGEDALDLLDALPLDRVAYVHVAGGSFDGRLYHDTHTDPVPSEVLDLITALCERHQPPGLMLERDGAYPPAADLARELDAIATAAGYPTPTASAAPPTAPAAPPTAAGPPAAPHVPTGGIVKPGYVIPPVRS